METVALRNLEFHVHHFQYVSQVGDVYVAQVGHYQYVSKILVGDMLNFHSNTPNTPSMSPRSTWAYDGSAAPRGSTMLHKSTNSDDPLSFKIRQGTY